MQCQEMAYTIGKALGLPTINVDSCFVEALCVCNCSAKNVLIQAINEMYEMSRKNVTKTDSQEEEAEAEGIHIRIIKPFCTKFLIMSHHIKKIHHYLNFKSRLF